MARWKLNENHYLFGHPPDLEETEWEYKETDRVNGRERRKRFKVPFYFEAHTIVCYEGRGLPTDSVFEGNPTPAMDPLDDEAKAISDKLRPFWIHPIDSLEGQGFTASIPGNLEKQMDELSKRLPTVPIAAANDGASRAEFEELKAQLAALMAENAEIKAAQSKEGIRR